MPTQRRGRAAAGAVDLLSDLLLKQQDEQRQRRLRAEKLAEEFQYQARVKEYEKILNGEAQYDPQTGQFQRLPSVVPTVGPDQSMTTSYDAQGRPSGYSVGPKRSVSSMEAALAGLIGDDTAATDVPGGLSGLGGDNFQSDLTTAQQAIQSGRDPIGVRQKLLQAHPQRQRDIDALLGR